MDAIDDAILRELTTDARLPFRELGVRVGLSANAAAARVRRMQDDGTIRGFTVVTSQRPFRGGPGRAGAAAPADPGRAGAAAPVGQRGGGEPGADGGPAAGGGHGWAALEVFIEVRLAPETTNDDFTAALTRPPGFPQVLDAVHVTGSYDYLLHATVADPPALDQLVRRLKRDAGAAQTFTRLALRGAAG
ncbi:Lrp/AsnC family transcriptional regulator [Cellulomonas sp.]|uniref:Lrp/AsnC family transcriptional regulator n=1 Tax=Cellulomonas sp. TaxID=40001 RepID=UPI001B1D9048|nr:Lrp/AsnC family transcriptional regulator [Cellulomonas sp.]MBO9555318.1 Lrp/AsnC family transcriptional regulator [Cellulomonas sp.]